MAVAQGNGGVVELRFFVACSERRGNHCTRPAKSMGVTLTDCASDMVVDNFDHTQPNPLTPPLATIANPNLQVAAVFSNCQNTVDVRILDVDPANHFQISQHSAWIQPRASIGFGLRRHSLTNLAPNASTQEAGHAPTANKWQEYAGNSGKEARHA